MPEAHEAHEIVHVLGAVSPQAEEQVASLVAVLQSWGYSVRVVGPMTRTGRRLIHSVGAGTREAPEPSGESVAGRWSDARRLSQIIRDNRPMLIHGHGFRATLSALLARRGMAHTVPVVASPHLQPHRLREDPRFGLRRRGYRWVLEHSDAILVPTETQREDLADLHAAASDRADLIPYPRPSGAQPDSLDLGRRRAILGITQAAVVVGCVVDDLAPADLTLFLDAGASLCMEYPSLEFALIGRDVDRPEYHDLAHRRGLLGATVFVDPGDRFRRAISSLNVLVTPQRGWPSGMLALQALGANVGVVAIEDGEVAEMLIGSPHVGIAPAEGPGALADAIMRRLRAAAEQMEPARDAAPESTVAASFLVSKEFYAIEDSWGTLASRGSASSEASHADPAGDFHPTRVARALVGVYHRLLDEV